jgi:choline-sulfatase
MRGITRREFGKRLTSAVGAAGLWSAGFPAASAGALEGSGSPRRPNIVFINSDNQSFQDTGYAGHPHIRTPNLDRIARQGVVFSNAYCSSPVCTPSRASMMTGMYPSDSDSYCNATPWDGSQPTWGTHLRNAGYYTRSIGKLDLHRDYDTGFEEFGALHNHVDNPDITALFRRPLCYRVQERPNITGGSRAERHLDAGWADLANGFIREEASGVGRPWAVNIGFHEPHVYFFEQLGFLALEKYYDLYPPDQIRLPHVPAEDLRNQHIVFQELRHFKRIATPIAEERVRRAHAGYYGMISELDEYVGRVWDALAETGQLENTVFIFTSDNGMSMGEHGLFYHNHLYDQAAKVPLVIAGAGVPRGIRIDAPVGHVDVVATLLEWAGSEAATRVRGRSLNRLIQGEPGAAPEFVYCENHSEGNCTGSFAIRKGDWKYIHFTWYGDVLFNIAEDPGEFNNRIDQPETKGIQAELRALLQRVTDPEEMTLRAFGKQEGILKGMVERMSEEEIHKALEVRLGPGQARALATKYKRSPLFSRS